MMSPTSRGNDLAGYLASLAFALTALVAPPAANAAPPSGLRPALNASELFALRHQIDRLEFTRMADAFADGRAGAEVCRVRPARVRCRTVEWSGDEGRLTAERIALGGEEVRLDEVEFTPAGSSHTYAIDRLVYDRETLTFESLRIRGETDAELNAETGRIESASIQFSELVWRRPASGSTDGRPRVRSDEARFGTDGWEFDRLRRVSPPGVGIGNYRAPEGRPSTGFVPPRLTYGGGRFEWTQWAVHGPSLLGLSASAAPPDRWFGLGPAVQTPTDENPFVEHAPRPALLDGQLRWNPRTRDLGWRLTGAFRRGTEYTHVGAHLEEQSTDEYWRTGRVEAPGLLRNWRASRAGVSLSGPGHHLQLRFGHWSRTSIDASSDDRIDSLLSGEEFGLGLEYGAVHHPTDFLEASTGVFHQNTVREGAPDDHRTTAVGDVTARLGSRSGAYAEAGVTAMLGTEIGPAPSGRGTAAVGSSQLLAHVGTGVTVSGRPGESTIHRIAPKLAAYRDVATFGETDGGTSDARRVGATPGWTSFVGWVDQSLRWRGGGLSLPVGLLAHGTKGGALIEATHGFGRLRVDVARYALSGGLRHRIGAGETALDAGASRYGERLDVSWQLTTDATGDRHLARIDRIATDPIDAARLLQPFADPGAETKSGPLFQTLTAGGEIGEIRTDVGLFSEGEFDDQGVTLGIAHPFDPLGWGLALEGAYAVGSRRWGVSAGLTTSTP